MNGKPEEEIPKLLQIEDTKMDDKMKVQTDLIYQEEVCSEELYVENQLKKTLKK